ncbi:MAG: 3'-5' exonuclease, partial [Anaerolineales bacterium]
DATKGEKLVKKLLGQNLPKEFTVYVETPVRKKRELRYPDFIVVTNYGVIVLEVKDWIHLEQADPTGGYVINHSGGKRRERNPVDTARDYAIALSNELHSHLYQGKGGEAIPWSYAAILINLPTAKITQLRRVWGEEFVFGRDDLENPDILLNRLKQTFPVQRIRPLSKDELKAVRGVIFPIVRFEPEGRTAVTLDEEQEKIVAEPAHQEAEPLSRKGRQAEQKHRQEEIFESLRTPEMEEELPPEGERIIKNVSIRLVRGFSGSGKTLVLIQRALFLAALYPEWKIGVLTFNTKLQEQLEQVLKEPNIKTCTFHSLCTRYLFLPNEQECRIEDWLKSRYNEYPLSTKFDQSTVEREIDWLRDIGITNREQYLAVERKGIGKEARLTTGDRNAIFDIYEAYREYLHSSDRWDWNEVPLKLLTLLAEKHCSPEVFDAILIDEAQDWAPVWFKVVEYFVHPEHGYIFLADDPSQSIYRYFSWKEKGIPVVGRTRWLRVPYRNTFEIYRAAYSLIAAHEEIQKSLMEEGELIRPDFSAETMRHGWRPLVRKCRNVAEELEYVKNTITALQNGGIPEKQIAVLVRYRSDKTTAEKALAGTGVEVHPIHGFKGLEVEAVILPHLQSTFSNEHEEGSERRLMYVAMTRARSRLVMTYSGRLPAAYQELCKQGVVDFLQ